LIGLTTEQRRFLKTLDLRHGERGRDNLAGLAPDVAAALGGTTRQGSARARLRR
jgi:hypothetical protein